MLHLILGCAGSGKTHWIREKLCAFARQPESPKLLLLVPEQYSFESERAILRLLGPQMAQKVEVMSFRGWQNWCSASMATIPGRFWRKAAAIS